MADYFYYTIQKIHNRYIDNASNIWNNNSLSATVVKRFSKLRRGTKILTMAANILARNFKIPIKDCTCIDISPDIQVNIVFRRIGFIPKMQ